MSPENDTPQHDDEATKRKFRKKPLEVEAMQWDGTNADELSTWTDGAFNSSPCGNTEDHSALVTACLYVAANVQHLGIVTGEWIIADQAGFYPCKPDIFEATYDAVEFGVTKGLPGLADKLAVALPNAAQAEQRARGAEADLAGARRGKAFADGIATQFPRLSDMPTMPNKAEQGIISYASENAEAAFAAALDLIGRRTDIVAVQLPEPTAPSWPDGQLASFGDFEDTDHDVSVLVNAYPGQVSIGFNNFSPNTARNLAAALLAAAARADAADGAK